MMKMDNTVKKETLYIATWNAIFSVLMQAVFLIIGKWDWRVVLGNLLGFSGATLNFLFMGLTVQKAVQKEEKDAKTTMKLSQTYRNFFILGIALLGFLAPCFNAWAVIIPFFFPRIAIAFRQKQDK